MVAMTTMRATMPRLTVVPSTTTTAMTSVRFFAKQAKEAKGGNKSSGGGSGLEFNASAFDAELVSSLERLQTELAGVRTNRASPDLLQSVVVKSRDGSVTPLKALAQVSVKDPKTLLVSVFDETQLSAVQSAIQQTDLGLNPSPHGSNALLVPVPKLTSEFRDKLLKLVSAADEAAKQRVRRARTDVLKHLKDCKLPEDESKRLEKVIDEQTKQFNKKATDLAAKKTSEISAAK